MFAEKAQALKAKEEMETQSQSLVTMIEQAYKIVLELNIREDAKTSAKVRKLATTASASKNEVEMVNFYFQVNILEL